MSIRDWWPWARERRTNELADELRAHLDMAQADRVARGETPRDAAANARREFGNPGLALEVARDEWGRGAMAAEQFGRDVRFALRLLRRAPGVAGVAIVTMALGIATTTAIYSLVAATLLHPLPYPRAEQLVRIEDDLVGIGARNVGMSTPEWRDLQRAGVFQHVSPSWFDNNNLTGLAHAQRVALMIVAPNYFTLLGVKPQLGAAFDPSDRTPGFNTQALISDALWKGSFGGNPDVVGRIVQLDSDSYRIVGVMPPGFQPPERTGEERRTEVWVAFGFAGAPLSDASVRSRASLFPTAIARLDNGVSIDEARRRVDALVKSLRQQLPGDYPARSDWKVRLVPLKDSVVGDLRQPLLFLLGAVSLVLLIGCANVANLLLARAATRGREMAVRQALGGAPSRLMRQLLTEGVVLAMLGGILGVTMVFAAKGSLVRLVPDGVPMFNEVSINWGVLLFSLGASLVAGAVFGLAPALYIRDLDVTGVLKLEGRGATATRRQKRTRRMLVVAEFALSLVLLSAAGLLVRSFWQLLDVPLGFDPQNVTVLRTRLPYPNDPKEDLYPTAGAEMPFVSEVIRRCRALPGVDEVALGSGAAVPLDHPYQDQTVLRVRFEGDASHGEQPLFVTGSEVTPEYFHLLGIKLVRGRLLDAFDADSTPPVAVINESMARTYWPGEDALGKRMKLSTRATTWTTVVGLVADARTESLASSAEPHLYASLYQQQGKHLAIFLRGHLQTASIAQAVRDEVQKINAALPVFGAVTLNETVSEALAVRRLSMKLIAMSAVIALLLAAFGLYGVMSYTVTERAGEIGLRRALGAGSADIVGMIMRQGAALAMTGVGVGLVGSVIVSHAMAGLLVGVSPTDPLTLVLATILLTAVALAGCFLPTRRAVRVDPIVALHT
jgi:predicted permease